MHVCTCSNQELLSIEDRLEGVKKLYCENFPGCSETLDEAPPIELAPLETSGMVYLRAVHRDLARHHLLSVIPGPAVPTPMMPLATTLAPRAGRRLAAPLVGMVAVALLVGAALTLALPSPPPGIGGGGGSSQAQGSLALVTTDDRDRTPFNRKAAPAPVTQSVPAASAPSDLVPVLESRVAPVAVATAPRRSVRRAPKKTLRRALVKADPPAPQGAERRPAPEGAERRPAPEGAERRPAVAKQASPEPAAGLTLERILKNARGKSGTVLPPPEVLPEKLGAKAYGQLQAQLRRRTRHCLKKFGFTHVTARVRLRLRGDRGRVTWVKMRGRLKGTPVGRCIELVARHLRVPRFKQSRQTLTIPFRY